MVLRSVGYQSVPLPGVPFDPRASVVPNAAGRVLGPDGAPLPGEYVAGWLKRGPTGVIGTNKSDAAQTVRALLADLAGGPGPGDVPLPRAGLLRMPAPAPAPAPAATAAATDKPAVVIEPGAAGGQSAAGGAGQASAAAEAGLTAEEVAAEAAEVAAMEAAEAGAAEATDLAVLSRFEQLLEARGIRPVSYADWLRIEAAEEELAVSLGRGARVKLPSREHLHRAYGPGS